MTQQIQHHNSDHIDPTATFLVIVDNGFVYVGNIAVDNDLVVITNGANVRKAETTRGFGELAMEGPNKGTTLDPCPIVLVPVGRVCHYMRCDSAKWDGVVKAL